MLQILTCGATLGFQLRGFRLKYCPRSYINNQQRLALSSLSETKPFGYRWTEQQNMYHRVILHEISIIYGNIRLRIPPLLSRNNLISKNDSQMVSKLIFLDMSIIQKKNKEHSNLFFLYVEPNLFPLLVKSTSIFLLSFPDSA